MTHSFALQLYSIALAVIIDIEVTYEVTMDADYYHIGEGTAWRSYWELNHKALKCSLNNRPYTPTNEDLGAWEDDIEHAIQKEVERSAA